MNTDNLLRLFGSIYYYIATVDKNFVGILDHTSSNS